MTSKKKKKPTWTRDVFAGEQARRAAELRLKTEPRDSWWVGLPREQLNAEAKRRHPGQVTARVAV